MDLHQVPLSRHKPGDPDELDGRFPEVFEKDAYGLGGFREGMADSDRVPIGRADTEELLQLVKNGAHFQLIVEKNVSARRRHVKFPGCLEAFGVACSQAVYKKKPPLLDDLKGFVHLFLVRGKFGAHVVVHPCRAGNGGDVLFHDAHDPLRPVSHIKRSRARVYLRVSGLHGLMEHNFMARVMKLKSQIFGPQEVRQDGKCHGDAEIGEKLGPGNIGADIINNQGEARL